MTISLEERQLIARAVKRDREAFAALYVQYYDPLWRRLSHLVDSREEACDIASETFLRAWNAIDRFEDRDVSIQAWLYTIAERLAFKQLKKRRPQMDVDDVVLEANPRYAPEEVVEREADADAVRRALVQLPELQRQVLSRHFLDESSYGDIGASLGKSVGAIRVIQHRGLKALKIIVNEARGHTKPAATGAAGE